MAWRDEEGGLLWPRLLGWQGTSRVGLTKLVCKEMDGFSLLALSRQQLCRVKLNCDMILFQAMRQAIQDTLVVG